MLIKLGVVKSRTKATVVFESIFPSFIDVQYSSPSDYVRICWSEYSKSSYASSNMQDSFLELILATLFIREGLLPFYPNAKLSTVPNVIYDLMFYSAERGPICWSVKTSLRERYKQADLESIALKYVHRKALSYLITLEKNEAKGVKAKIKSGDVIGLDEVIVATEPEFDILVSELKAFKFEKPPIVEVISSNQIVTLEKVTALNHK